MGDPLAIVLTDPERLRHAMTAVREAAGLSQERLAAEVGVGHATIKRWEDGSSQPMASALLQFFQACGYSVVVLTAGRAANNFHLPGVPG